MTDPIILDGEPVLNVMHKDGRLEIYLHQIPNMKPHIPVWQAYSNVLASVVHLLARETGMDEFDILGQMEKVMTQVTDRIRDDEG
jgi:hypothetical protein